MLKSQRKIKNNVYRIIQKTFCLLLATIMLFSTMASASTETGHILNKMESVYINIDNYGTPTKVNIYNDFNFANIDTINDYGKYEKIQVITGEEKPIISGDKISWNISGDKKLGYIGTADTKLANQMPWNISIKYYLNGVETLASELPHKSGLVKVKIKVIPNKEAPVIYQNNYMMEIKASFDMTKYTSVTSDEAIEAIVGNTKSLTFMILPGHEKEVSIEIGTENFKMDSISFAMVPLEGDLLELIQDIVEDKNKLREAWDATNESLDVILNSLSNTSKSLDKIIKSTNELENGLDTLNSGTDQRIEDITSFKNELETISGDFTRIDEKISQIIVDANYLKERANETKDFLEKLKLKLIALSTNMEKNEKDLERIEKRSKDLPDDLEKLEDLLVSTKSSIAELNKLLRNIDATGDIDINAISKSLKSIKESTEDIGTEAGIKLQTGGEDPEFYTDVIQTAQSIGKDLQSVATELQKAEDLMGQTNTNTGNLSKDLVSLQGDLLEVADVIEGYEEYSKDVPDTIKNANNTIKSINSIINTFVKEIDNNNSKDNKKLNEEIDTLTSLLSELQKLEKDLKVVNSTIQSELILLQNDLYTISNQMHSGTKNTINGTQGLLKDFKTISNQSTTLKNAKNQIYNVITSDIDDLENKTTIFDMDPDMPNLSFASEKNESPKKVQIFVQTDAIKEYEGEDITDLEPKKESMTFWEKILLVFKKISEFFKNLFK